MTTDTDTATRPDDPPFPVLPRSVDELAKAEAFLVEQLRAYVEGCSEDMLPTVIHALLGFAFLGEVVGGWRELAIRSFGQADQAYDMFEALFGFEHPERIRRVAEHWPGEWPRNAARMRSRAEALANEFRSDRP